MYRTGHRRHRRQPFWVFVSGFGRAAVPIGPLLDIRGERPWAVSMTKPTDRWGVGGAGVAMGARSRSYERMRSTRPTEGVGAPRRPPFPRPPDKS